MLEDAGTLRTWRLLEEPGAGRTVTAQPIADHRLEYLDYEGPVSGDRGEVKRWDAGTFEWIDEEKNRPRANLSGSKLSGGIEIADGTAKFDD